MFYNKREQLKAVFEDTVKRIQSDQFLRESTEKSVRLTKHFAVNDYPSFESSSPKKGAVTVSRHSTFEAARKLYKKYPDKRIAVLNFASATNPGGGVTRGSSAQEEALCRCSTLYPTLKQKPMCNLPAARRSPPDPPARFLPPPVPVWQSPPRSHGSGR